MKDLLEEYRTRYEEFVQIDDLNIDQKLKQVPHEKHYYVARYIDAKRDKDRLQYKLKKFYKMSEEEALKDSPVNLNKRELEQNFNDLEDVVKVKEKIHELDYVIEYLDMVIRQITFIGNDMKNIIEWKKLEYL